MDVVDLECWRWNGRLAAGPADKFPYDRDHELADQTHSRLRVRSVVYRRVWKMPAKPPGDFSRSLICPRQCLDYSSRSACKRPSWFGESACNSCSANMHSTSIAANSGADLTCCRSSRKSSIFSSTWCG